MINKFGSPEKGGFEAVPVVRIVFSTDGILYLGDNPLEDQVIGAESADCQDPSGLISDEEYFRYNLDEDNVFNSVKNIVEFTRENGIKNLIFVDRAARPINAGVSEYYKTAYPEEDMPSMFFINPKGFRSADSADFSDELMANYRSYDNFDIFETTASMPDEGVSFQQFSEEHPYLAEKIEEPIMIIDTCMHSGISISSVLEKFQEFGFSDVRLALGNTSSPEERRTGITPDLKFSDIRSCYPFAGEDLVAKKYGSTVSVPSRTRTDMTPSALSEFNRNAVVQRRVIRQIIRDKLAQTSSSSA